MYNKNLKQGFYKPINPAKYRGDVDNIVFRSGLECNYFRYFDLNKNVLEWSSEEVQVPYIGLDGKTHRYFVDVWVKVKTKKNEIKQLICEIKPESFLKEPKPQQRMTKKWKNRYAEYLTNMAKFEAAKKFAEKTGMKFIILTEKDIK